MSPAAPPDLPADRQTAPRTKQFRRRAPSTIPPPDQLRRQEAVLQSAWNSFGDAGLVIAFLNSRHEGLGGQPLQVALHSDEGLFRVEQLLGDIPK